MWRSKRSHLNSPLEIPRWSERNFSVNCRHMFINFRNYLRQKHFAAWTRSQRRNPLSVAAMEIFALTFDLEKGQKCIFVMLLRVEITQFSSCAVLRKQKIDHVLSLGELRLWRQRELAIYCVWYFPVVSRYFKFFKTFLCNDDLWAIHKGQLR